MCWRRKHSITEKADLRLLIPRECQRSSKVRHRAGDKTTVVAPGEVEVGSNSFPLAELILQLRSLFELLIVVDAKHTRWQIRIKEQAARFRWEESCPRMAGDCER